MRAVLAVSVLASLAACTLPQIPVSDFESPELKADRASLQGKGFSNEYIDGHVDGCASGNKSAGNPDYSFAKDAPQRPDADYLQGWNDGFALCKGRFEDYATHATPPAEKN
ncbi:hypothetical protein [Pararobbsia silviterrae]|nr:hypothetical protein [Pararobbsia silviterrae]